MINDKIFFDEKDPTGISYDTPFTVYGSYDGRLWSKTPAGTVKFYTQTTDTENHNDITGRDVEDAHPIGAITGLNDTLGEKVNKSGDTMTGDLGFEGGARSIGTEDANDLILKTNNTERIRINSGGALLTNPSNGLWHITRNATVAQIQDINLGNSGSRVVMQVRGGTWNSSDTSSILIQLLRNDGNEVGSIRRSGAFGVTYNTTSDYRLKEDIKPLKNSIERVKRMNPVSFKWKGSEDVLEGFIAHELQEVIPNAVTGEKDDKDMQTVSYADTTVVLTSALKDLINRVEELENKIQNSQ